MKDRMTRYYKVTGDSQVNCLKADVYYSLGGMNYSTYRNEPRGYYMSVLPVKRERRDYGITESFSQSGLKTIVLPVQRKSQKKMNEAIKYFNEHIEEFIENHFGEFDVNIAEYEEA